MAGLSCSSRFIKLLIILINFIVLLAGCVLFIIGLWFVIESNTHPVLQVAAINKYAALMQAAAVILIIVGGVMALVSTLGCCAAFKENAECLMVFATILIVLVIGQVITGILAGIYRTQVLNELVDTFKNTLQNDYGKTNKTAETDAWDFLEVQFHCCGVTGPKDWLNSSWTASSRNHTAPVPVSCCVLTNSDFKNPLPVNATLCYADVNANSSAYINRQGCQDSVEKWIAEHFSVIIGIAIGLIGAQVLSILMVCILYNDVRNKGIIN